MIVQVLQYIIVILIGLFIAYNVVFYLSLAEKKISQLNKIFAFIYLYSIPYNVIKKHVLIYRNLDSFLWHNKKQLKEVPEEVYEEFKSTFSSAYLVLRSIIKTLVRMNLLKSLIVIPRISEAVEKELRSEHSSLSKKIIDQKRKREYDKLKEGYDEKTTGKIIDAVGIMLKH